MQFLGWSGAILLSFYRQTSNSAVFHSSLDPLRLSRHAVLFRKGWLWDYSWWMICGSTLSSIIKEPALFSSN
jgi:hypothetical protein